MKKLLFTLCAAAGITAAGAQDNLLEFFPNEEGTQIISKCYDAADNLQGVMTMTVMRDYEYVDGEQLDLNFVITDANGNLRNQGKIEAEYFDGTFRMDMKTNALSPTMGQYISMTTELLGDFLDYPDFTRDPKWLDGDFDMEGGSFTINSADSRRPIASVRKYNRMVEGSEEITTPAGTFDATKISFVVEVQEEDETTTYRGVEWYSAGSGIVRSEIYDEAKNLLDYTVLTDINKPARR